MRNTKLYIDDIAEALRNVIEFTAGLSQAEFSSDKRTRDATIRNLEIVGEAAKKVPEAIRLLAGDIPWRRLAGLRDILIHDYFGIDAVILWDIVSNEVPVLLPKIDLLREQLASTVSA